MCPDLVSPPVSLKNSLNVAFATVLKSPVPMWYYIDGIQNVLVFFYFHIKYDEDSICVIQLYQAQKNNLAFLLWFGILGEFT